MSHVLTNMSKNRYILPLTLMIVFLFVACTRINNPEGWSGAVVNGNSIYIGTSDGSLLALDKIDGSTLWRRELQTNEDENQAIYGKVAVSEDTIYVGGYNGSLYMFGFDGTDIGWGNQPLGGPIVGGPVLVDNLLIVGTGADDSHGDKAGSVYAVDSETGAKVWRFQTDDSVWSSPTVVDDIVYVGTLGKTIYAINLHDGSEIWRLRVGGAIVASPIVSNGMVYVGAFDSAFYALDAETGELEWKFTDADRWYWSRALAIGTTIFASSLDGNLYALDANTGTRLWTFESEGAIVGSPSLVSGMLAIPVADGKNSKIHLIELNGSVKDACRIGEEVRTPLVTDGNLIYFGAMDKSIRALSVGGNGNPDEEWVYFTDKDDPLPRDRAKAC